MSSRPRNSTAQPDRGLAARAELARTLAVKLGELWPQATCELDHRDAYQLLVATILAAQSTDKLINTVTPALFAHYPDATALAAADPAELEREIHSTGFFRMKAKHLLGMARAVVERHGGAIPATMADLVALPGVARKTANVVLGTAFGVAAGVVVDTHVTRLSARLGLTEHTDPVKIEEDLQQLLPQGEWVPFPNRLIWHGRRVCFARKPACESCGLAPLCPSAELLGGAASAAAAGAAKPTRRVALAARPRAAAAARGRGGVAKLVDAKPSSRSAKPSSRPVKASQVRSKANQPAAAKSAAATKAGRGARASSTARAAAATSARAGKARR